MKKIFLVLLLLSCAAVAACGAASAPPVDLPAPVVGRVTAGPPGDSGKSTITGTEGAVEPNTIVLGINDRLDTTTTAALWKLTDAIVPSAYAQSLPEICALLGHACAQADSGGAFTFEIDSIVGDTIILVLIDATGTERSPRVTILIPTSLLISSCASATDAVGTLVDLASANDMPIVLFEGLGDLSNILRIGGVEFALPGCYAKQLAISNSPPDGFAVTMISTSDRLVWVSKWTDVGIVVAKTFQLTSYPEAVAFDGDPAYLLLLTFDGSNFNIERMSLTDGSIVASAPIPQPTDGTGTTLSGALALRTIGPFADGGWLAAVVTYGSNMTDTYFYGSLFETSALTNVMTAGENVQLGVDLFMTTVTDIRDMQIAGDVTQTNRPVFIAVTDHGDGSSGYLFLAHLEFDPASTPVYLDASNALSLGPELKLFYDSAYDLKSTYSPNLPSKFVLTESASTPIAYLLTDSLNLWEITNYPYVYGSYTEVFTPIPGASEPTTIAWDHATGRIIAGDNGLKDILDLTTLLGL